MNPFIIAQVNLDPFLQNTDRDPFEKKDLDTNSFNWINLFDSDMSTLFNIGMTIITIIFVVSVCIMALSIVFKNGQWTKWSTGVMVLTLMIVLILRGGVILLFSSDKVGITTLFTDTLELVKKIGIYAALVMVLVGVLMRYNHILINHPDYHRWSKRLIIGSIIILVLATLMPSVLLGV